MKQIILLTHSTMAQGTKETIELLIGKQESIHAINAYVSEVNVEEELKNVLDRYKESQILIFTDMFGSSVNTLATKYANEEEIVVVAGFNLPLVLDILLKDGRVTISEIQESINDAKDGIKLVNVEIKKELDESEFF